MNYRLARVCEILKRELSAIILREIRSNGALITLNAVDISPDLKNATVHIAILGSEAQQKQVMEELEAHRGVLQSECAKRVVLKFTPHLHFQLDTSIERGRRILDILEEIGADNLDLENVEDDA